MFPSVFFDLEKPKKESGDSKEKKKLRKRIMVILYKASVLLMAFFLLSILVFFTVSAVNSSDDSGYFTNGSPTSLFWISGLYFMMTFVFIYDLFTYVLFLRCFTVGFRFGNVRDIVNIESYFTVFVYRFVWFLFFTILAMINWICYGLIIDSRDHLAGWLSCYGLVSIFSYLIIAYNQYNSFKNDKNIDFDGETIFTKSKANILCFFFGVGIKFISFLCFSVVGAVLILYTIQSIALVQDITKVPGKKVPITIDHHTFNLHVYCEGDTKTGNVALIDADIGIPSPYEYMKKLVTSLAQSGIRACVIERAGYGFSDTGPLPRNGNQTISELVSFVYEFRMRIPFVYIAHSSASFTARLLYAQYPELVSGLVLLHPSHEDQEDVYLKQAKNLTTQEIQIRKDTRDYIDDVIRFVTPIALPRLFKYFHFEFLLEYEDPYELYYMNGWKTYFDNITNGTINKKVIFQNKYTGCVWSELKHSQTDTADLVRNLRPTSNSVTVPVVILTAQYLVDGDCSLNHFEEGTTMCSHFNAWKTNRGIAIKKLHGDLASIYNGQWEMIPSSYDIPLDAPEIVVKHVLNVLKVNGTR